MFTSIKMRGIGEGGRWEGREDREEDTSIREWKKGKKGKGKKVKSKRSGNEEGKK